MVPGYELLLAQMLFIGDKDAQNLAKKLLKVDVCCDTVYKKQTIKTVNNSVQDVFLFRISEKFSSFCPFTVRFITSDKALAQLFDSFPPGIGINGEKSLVYTEFGIIRKYEERWNQLYKNKIYPIMICRAQSSHAKFNRMQLTERIKRDIATIEKKVIQGTAR